MPDKSQNNILSDFINMKQSIGIAWTAIGLVTLLFSLALGFYFHIELFVFGILVGLFYIYLIFTFPKVWLYSLAVLSGVFFQSTSDDVSIFDILSAAMIIGSICIWFFWQVIVCKKKVVYNLGDWFILAFYGFLIFNAIIAYLNNVDLFVWLREYLMFSIILIYFPIRYVIKNEKDLLKFLAFYALVISGVGLFQMYDYYTRFTQDFVYAWELKHGNNINQTLYTCASIFGFIFTFHQTKKKNELLIILFTAITVITLIATFSRTFWLVLLVTILIIFFILPFKKKSKMLAYLMVILGIFTILGFGLLHDKMMLLFQIVGSRFTSSADGTQDISVIARLMEWEQVIKKIFENPLGGNGLAKTFNFYYVIESRTSHTIIIHNGFLFILYRVGIPTALMFFGFLIFYTIKAYDNIIKSKTNYLRALSLANFAIMLALYIVNFTSHQYFYRDGLFVTAFVTAFIGINDNLIKNRTKIIETSNGL